MRRRASGVGRAASGVSYAASGVRRAHIPASGGDGVWRAVCAAAS